MDIRLQHPFACILAGPSSCGKSYFVRKLLENAPTVLSQVPTNIVWLYSCWQPLYTILQQQFRHLRFVEGMPESLNNDHLLPPDKINLIIVDDLMTEGGHSGELEKAFTQYSHHRNLSICYIVQNIFNKGKSNRSMSLNASYIVLFKNPRDKQQLSVIARQMYPSKTRFFMEAYEDAVSKPYGYLLIDLKTTTPEDYRLRTDIFPPRPPAVYLPKKTGKNTHR
jgi:hypothetical protein